jgi:RHS repeat-associated protein
LTWDGTEQYRYDASNKRVFRRWTNGIGQLQETYSMYGVNGKVTAELAAVYDPAAGVQPGMVLTPTATYQYVGIRKVGWNEGMEDRLGTKPAGGGRPYGENVSQYATHQKDATGLHYADQRYYQASWGRFTSPDQFMHNPKQGDPQSWNLYSYTDGDPINNADPTGLFTDPCAMVGCLMAPPDMDSPGTGGGGIIWAGGPVCVYNSWLPVPACLVPVAFAPQPPPQAPQPPPLECKFTGATIHEPGFGQADNLPTGYHMPVNFNFTATGGSGTYAWSNTQTVNVIGTITWSDGASVDLSRLPRNQRERLSNQTTPASSPRASFFDAPGLAATRRNAQGDPVGTVVSASINWSFSLQVSVSSGGETVNCPTVSWSAMMRWRTVDGRPVVTGNATVITRPTP